MESENYSFKEMYNKKLRIIQKDKELEDNIKYEYAMIFKEFYLSQMKNIIKEHPEYGSIINDNLNIMDAIAHSTHKHIWETYPYMSLK